MFLIFIIKSGEFVWGYWGPVVLIMLLFHLEKGWRKGGQLKTSKSLSAYNFGSSERGAISQRRGRESKNESKAETRTSCECTRLLSKQWWCVRLSTLKKSLKWGGNTLSSDSKLATWSNSKILQARVFWAFGVIQMLLGDIMLQMFFRKHISVIWKMSYNDI